MDKIDSDMANLTKNISFYKRCTIEMIALNESKLV